MHEEARYLLYRATEAEKTAIKLVDLFIAALSGAAIRARRDQLVVRPSLLNEYFPEFARIHAPEATTRRNAELYECNADGECPAVTIHELMGREKGTRTLMVHILHLHHQSAEESNAQEVEEIIRATPFLSLNVEYPVVVAYAYEVLQKAGQVPVPQPTSG